MWTKKIPEAAGYYWAKYESDDKCRIVKLTNREHFSDDGGRAIESMGWDVPESTVESDYLWWTQEIQAPQS